MASSVFDKATSVLATPMNINENVTITATLTVNSLIETSSIELKENIVPIDNALESLMQLQAYTYDRVDGSSFKEPGLIAEQVYEVLPEVVSLDVEGNPGGIFYTKLSVYLLEAIKSLKSEVDELKAKLNNGIT